MSPALSFVYELIRVSLWLGIPFMAFFVLHRPPTRARRWGLLILMGAWAVGNKFVFVPYIAGSWVLFYGIHFTSFALFALVCGNPRRSMITVIYVITAAVAIDYIGIFARVVFNGAEQFLPDSEKMNWFLNSSLADRTRILADNGVWLLWTVLYCRISQKYPVTLALRSWILAVLPPVISSCALVYLWDVTQNLFKTGTDIAMIGFVTGIFLFLLHCFLFYWHIKLLANGAEKAEWQRLMVEAQNPAAVPQSRVDSNWSREVGLSEAFVAKYQFSEQERRALELAILGKAEKEIAKEMDVAPSTVKTYAPCVCQNRYLWAGRHFLAHSWRQWSTVNGKK